MMARGPCFAGWRWEGWEGWWGWEGGRERMQEAKGASERVCTAR